MEKLAHLNHLHMLGTVYINKIPENVEEVNEWLKLLVSKVNMSVLLGPFGISCQTLGNEGITSAIILEESHSTIHFWTKVEKPFFTYDIYSCNSFTPNIIIDHFSYFEPVSYEYMLIDRNGLSRVIAHGSYNWY